MTELEEFYTKLDAKIEEGKELLSDLRSIQKTLNKDLVEARKEILKIKAVIPEKVDDQICEALEVQLTALSQAIQDRFNSKTATVIAEFQRLTDLIFKDGSGDWRDRIDGGQGRLVQ